MAVGFPPTDDVTWGVEYRPGAVPVHILHTHMMGLFFSDLLLFRHFVYYVWHGLCLHGGLRGTATGTGETGLQKELDEATGSISTWKSLDTAHNSMAFFFFFILLLSIQYARAKLISILFFCRAVFDSACVSLFPELDDFFGAWNNFPNQNSIRDGKYWALSVKIWPFEWWNFLSAQSIRNPDLLKLYCEKFPVHITIFLKKVWSSISQQKRAGLINKAIKGLWRHLFVYILLYLYQPVW